MLELADDFTDILGKAMFGLKISVKELAEQSGLQIEEVDNLLCGSPNDAALLAVSKTLQLHGPSLVEIAYNRWHPKPVELEGLRQFTTPYSSFTVNSYLIWDPDSMEAALFDTGTSADEPYSFAQALGLEVTQVFLTHSHADHVMALPQIKKWGITRTYISSREPYPEAEEFEVGQSFKIGNLKISTCSTWGHSPGGTTYIIDGLERLVAIVGDALFAGSIGRPNLSYEAALTTCREEILTLPPETILCPGHGPMTSVAEEYEVNSFLIN